MPRSVIRFGTLIAQGRLEGLVSLPSRGPRLSGLPCAISVPNLITDRGIWVAWGDRADNVRRLMYQSLIWPLVAGDDACGLGPPLDAKDRQGLADPLVDGVRRNLELGGNFLGRQELVDEQQAVQLAGSQARNPRRHFVG